MIEFRSLYTQLEQTRLHVWVDHLKQQLDGIFETIPHGKHEEWEAVLQQLPDLPASTQNMDTDIVSAGTNNDLDNTQAELLIHLLKQLQPWRKGPYNLFGIHIDTEWHSDWKWQRIKEHISPLDDKLVLDIGCGNGYHMWRMLGAGARLVIGADPSRLFLKQFTAIKHYIGDQLPIHLLPLRGEDLPDFNQQGFDTVFSMGVLYHRKSPFAHLQELKSFLKPGGELVLETLVIEGDENTVLVPEDRYAKMRNVWFIPSTAMLERWLRRLGFSDIKVVDVNQTSTEEQRATAWMNYESLADFLDPNDTNLTIEGYPAPLRACLVCRR
ncbi:MAG: tRNA 5-methoxyuridine(34)/uridine 5-oxyacetic acid(34) synthase CmoB [Thiotrichaceae bacterium]